MPQNSPEYYEELMDRSFLATLRRQPEISNSLGITQEALTGAASLADITEYYPIPKKVFEGLTVGCVSHLMAEYLKDTGVQRHGISRLFYDRNQRKNLAHCIVSAVDSSLMAALNKTSYQPYIETIKTHLSTGVLDGQMRLGDNFPNIVRAIYKKTRGMQGWEFNQDVLDKLAINCAQESRTLRQNN